MAYFIFFYPNSTGLLKQLLLTDTALKGGQKLGVSPVLEARDLANPNVEYLGVMAWAAQFQVINTPTLEYLGVTVAGN
jgi:hypothetical protein